MIVLLGLHLNFFILFAGQFSFCHISSAAGSSWRVPFQVGKGAVHSHETPREMPASYMKLPHNPFDNIEKLDCM